LRDALPIWPAGGAGVRTRARGRPRGGGRRRAGARSSSSLLPFPARGGTLDGAGGGEVALFRFVARLGGFGFQVDILAFGLLDVLVEEAGGEAAIFEVVLHLVVAVELPRAVGHREHERAEPERDDDRGEHHRLRERVGDVRVGAGGVDRGAARAATGD